jgi:Golgi nucleoside diphosphatase
MSPLLDFALEHIPSTKVSETPLFILATAGMRLVEKVKQEAIIDSLRSGINSKYSFLFQEGKKVCIQSC